MARYYSQLNVRAKPLLNCLLKNTLILTSSCHNVKLGLAVPKSRLPPQPMLL